jgi:hypothetical protein
MSTLSNSIISGFGRQIGRTAAKSAIDSLKNSNDRVALNNKAEYTIETISDYETVKSLGYKSTIDSREINESAKKPGIILNILIQSLFIAFGFVTGPRLLFLATKGYETVITYDRVLKIYSLYGNVQFVESVAGEELVRNRAKISNSDRIKKAILGIVYTSIFGLYIYLVISQK